MDDLPVTSLAMPSLDLSLSDYVNQDRLWERHHELGEIGRTDKGGVNRQALTTEDMLARQRVVEWAGKLGAKASIDDIGNLFLRLPGSNPVLPAIMTGSHLDTQPTGGKFDGIFGVLAGLEVFEAFVGSGLQPERTIELVVWQNEEGCRFSPSTMGSGIYTGALNINDILSSTDSDGITVADALQRMQSTLNYPSRATSPKTCHAYLEAHIEQGPVLEDRNTTLGVVTGIQGLRQYKICIKGRTAHAGTTPRSGRQDAMATAVELISNITKSIDDPEDLVRFTVGQMDVMPNVLNTVAEQVVFTIDLRHPDDERLNTIERIIERLTATLPQCKASLHCLINVPTTWFDKTLVAEVETNAQQLGFSSFRLLSGATHDAHSMAALYPTSMIFVPCRDGISHNEDEAADPEHLWAGACVLANVIQKLSFGQAIELVPPTTRLQPKPEGSLS
jgi:beta-ureidopropionase / N-carbamoyl-L-amino-acid hydrolase